MGRPKALINWKRVKGFLTAGCSGAEIAGLIGVHPETLYDAVKLKYKTGFFEHRQ